MSRQEMYAWASLASSIAIVGFYVINVLGLSEGIPDYSQRLTQVFINVFIFAFIVELILGVVDSTDGIEKDERDVKYEGKGYKNAYYVMGLGITALMFNSLVGGFWEASPQAAFFADNMNTFHAMFLTLFVASIVNRLTQVFYYRKDA